MSDGSARPELCGYGLESKILTMRQHPFRDNGCVYNEDGTRCGAPEEDAIHRVPEVEASEATIFEDGTSTFTNSRGTEIPEPTIKIEVTDK